LCSHHDDWDVRQRTQVSVRVSGLAPGRRYVVFGTTIDDTHANAHTAWVRMDKPRPPSAEQRLLLQEASRLEPERLNEVAVDADGVTALSIPLRAHSVCLLELVPV
jgi:xylan 1,4-beta-xylosidase